MPALRFEPVMDLSFERFTAAFNRAYSDYFTPIVMTVPAFQALIDRENLDLNASVAALDDGQIVGMGMLGIRGDRGWIGGMGVIPGRRRQGIGRQLMQILLDHARQHDLNTVQLEVIEANTGAQALYRQTGFKAARYLHIVTREPHDMPPGDSAYRVVKQEAAAVLPYYDAFHDTRNCWQRGYRSLEGMAPHAEGLIAVDGDAVAGFAYGWFASDSIRLADLAARVDEPITRRAIAYALLTHAHTVYPLAHGNAFNIGEDDPLLEAYFAAGYRTQLRQIEMELPL